MNKWCIWGLGEHANRNILPAIQTIKSCEVSSIISRTTDSGKELPGIQIFDNPDQALASNLFDYVYVSTPNALHDTQVEKCIQYGKHVLVEKTAFSNLLTTKKMVNLAESKNVRIQEAFMYMYHPQFKYIQEVISGKYGDVKSVSINFTMPHFSNKKNIRYIKKLGGGALADAGAYCISAVAELFEQIELISSSLVTDCGYEVDTRGNALFRSNYDVLITTEWGFGLSYQNHIKIITVDYVIIVERVFSKPSTLVTKISIAKNNSIDFVITIPPSNHFVNMIECFTNNLNDNVFKGHERLLKISSLLNKIRSNDVE